MGSCYEMNQPQGAGLCIAAPMTSSIVESLVDRHGSTRPDWMAGAGVVTESVLAPEVVGPVLVAPLVTPEPTKAAPEQVMVLIEPRETGCRDESCVFCSFRGHMAAGTRSE